MSQPEPSSNHAAAWRQLRASLEEGSRDKGSPPWKRMAVALLLDLEGLGLPSLLLAARVGDRLVLSLADAAQLVDAPRVTLTFLPEDQTVQVAYSHGDIEAKAPLIGAWVSAPVAVQVTFGALRRLWTEARSTLPVPEELLRA